MSDIAQTSSFSVSNSTTGVRRLSWMIAWAVLVALALWFIFRNALHYYIDHSTASFGRYMPYRLPLLLHITGGVTAMLVGPLQVWMGYRRKPMHVHRWVGRVFVAAVAVGSMGAIWLALTVSMRNWAFATGLLALVAAWVSTTGMAWYAIRQRMFEIHKEWMIRAYVVTFAFVTFRIFSTTIPASFVPRRDLGAALAWACWAVPLLITELALQANRMRKAPPQRSARTTV